MEDVNTTTTESPAVSPNDTQQEIYYTVKEILSQTDEVSGTVWVQGYIIGCIKGNYFSKFQYGAVGENAVATNLVIADTPDSISTDSCMAIQLPQDTEKRTVRKDLNLADNPGNIFRLVRIHGKIEKYMGQKGLKTANQYIFPEQ